MRLRRRTGPTAQIVSSRLGGGANPSVSHSETDTRFDAEALGGRNDLNTLDLNAIDWGAFFTAAAALSRDIRNPFQNVVTLDQLAERGVLTVQKLSVAVAEEKLAAGGIGMGRARHGNDAADVGLVIELGLNLVARSAGPRHPALAFAGVGAAALDHEPFDDAMESGPIVEFFASEFLEIFDCFRCDIWPEGEGHFTVGSLDDGVFRSGFGSAHKRRSEPRAFQSRKNQNQRWMGTS